VPVGGAQDAGNGVAGGEGGGFSFFQPGPAGDDVLRA